MFKLGSYKGVVQATTDGRFVFILSRGKKTIQSEKTYSRARDARRGAERFVKAK
jgi:hypothetical protein